NATEREIAQALAALSEGDFATARHHAAEALTLSRGPRKTRKPRIDGPADAWIALLLLTDSDRDHRALAQSMLSLRRNNETMSLFQVR
ncbi:MAG: hypothetical protein KAI47_25365, partial [Deltaproteobacteria bacterium]|nr:hypothetical protein [Deltaproteobacteria bacterium]